MAMQFHSGMFLSYLKERSALKIYNFFPRKNNLSRLDLFSHLTKNHIFVEATNKYNSQKVFKTLWRGYRLDTHGLVVKSLRPFNKPNYHIGNIQNEIKHSCNVCKYTNLQTGDFIWWKSVFQIPLQWCKFKLKREESVSWPNLKIRKKSLLSCFFNTITIWIFYTANSFSTY
jgi:hypothetical protein